MQCIHDGPLFSLHEVMGFLKLGIFNAKVETVPRKPSRSVLSREGELGKG